MNSLGGWVRCFRWCQSFAKRHVGEAQKATQSSPKVFLSNRSCARHDCLYEIESRRLLCTSFIVYNSMYISWGGLFSDFWPDCRYFSVKVW